MSEDLREDLAGFVRNEQMTQIEPKLFAPPILSTGHIGAGPTLWRQLQIDSLKSWMGYCVYFPLRLTSFSHEPAYQKRTWWV